MKKSLLPMALWLAACGGDSTGGDPLPCAPQEPVPTGRQVWSAAPDGTCMLAASKNVPGSFFRAQFVPGGGARFEGTVDAARKTFHAALDGEQAVEVARGVLSPDGTLVVDAFDDGDGGIDARVSAVDGSREVVITELDFADRVDGVAWAPGSDKVMLNLENTSSSTADGPMLFDARLATIRSYVGQFYEGYTTWSPDGSRLVIDGSTTDETGLWLIPADRGDATRLTTGKEAGALWLDDGHVVATRNTGATSEGPYEIVKVDAGSGAVTPLATMSEPGTVVLRDVAPDGKTVAVWRARTATTQSRLYFVDVDSGAVTPIGDPGLSGWFGEFAPDNTGFVAAAGVPGEPARLYRVARDGTTVTPLTSGESASFAGWSADGARMMWIGGPLDDPQ
jgi:hypothetical protein